MTQTPANLFATYTGHIAAALARASFELLVGFQLSEAQIAYNATR